MRKRVAISKTLANNLDSPGAFRIQSEMTKIEVLLDIRDLLKNLLTKGTNWKEVPIEKIKKTGRRSFSKYDPMFSLIREGSAWEIEDKTFASSVYQALQRRKKFGAYLHLVGKHKGEILYIVHPKKEIQNNDNE